MHHRHRHPLRHHRRPRREEALLASAATSKPSTAGESGADDNKGCSSAILSFKQTLATYRPVQTTAKCFFFESSAVAPELITDTADKMGFSMISFSLYIYLIPAFPQKISFPLAIVVVVVQAKSIVAGTNPERSHRSMAFGARSSPVCA